MERFVNFWDIVRPDVSFFSPTGLYVTLISIAEWLLFGREMFKATGLV
jgi:hypothetical protein